MSSFLSEINGGCQRQSSGELLLLEAKNQYQKILIKKIKQPIYNGIHFLWEQTKERYPPYEVYREFQKKLERISKWNSDIVNKEYMRIIDKSKCEWFEDLLKQIFLINTQILLSVSSKPNKKITLKVPQGERFIHNCYQECARGFYSNVMLMEDRDLAIVLKSIKKIDQLHNLQKALELIENSIINTINNLLPFEEIVTITEEDENENDSNTSSNLSSKKKESFVFPDMKGYNESPKEEEMKNEQQIEEENKRAPLPLTEVIPPLPLTEVIPPLPSTEVTPQLPLTDVSPPMMDVKSQPAQQEEILEKLNETLFMKEKQQDPFLSDLINPHFKELPHNPIQPVQQKIEEPPEQQNLPQTIKIPSITFSTSSFHNNNMKKVYEAGQSLSIPIYNVKDQKEQQLSHLQDIETARETENFRNKFFDDIQ